MKCKSIFCSYANKSPHYRQQLVKQSEIGRHLRLKFPDVSNCITFFCEIVTEFYLIGMSGILDNAKFNEALFRLFSFGVRFKSISRIPDIFETLDKILQSTFSMRLSYETTCPRLINFTERAPLSLPPQIAKKELSEN